MKKNILFISGRKIIKDDMDVFVIILYRNL